jgi:hypothetical protein
MDNLIHQLDKLNGDYSDYKKSTNKPNAFQTFFGMHHTLTWQFEASDLRLAAWKQLKNMLSDLSDDDKLTLVQHAMKLDLFKEHRSNYAMTKNTKNTFTINVLIELEKEIKAQKNLKDEEFIDKFSIYPFSKNPK